MSQGPRARQTTGQNRPTIEMFGATKVPSLLAEAFWPTKGQQQQRIHNCHSLLQSAFLMAQVLKAFDMYRHSITAHLLMSYNVEPRIVGDSTQDGACMGMAGACLQQTGRCLGIGGPEASVGGSPRCTHPPVLHHSIPALTQQTPHVNSDPGTRPACCRLPIEGCALGACLNFVLQADCMKQDWTARLTLLSDTHSVNIRRPYSDAQNRSAWKARTVIVRI